MKSRPDGICLCGFHYSDLNKPSHCYGTLQSPWNTQKPRAWCSRLSPQAAIPAQISSKRCLVKTSAFNQLRTRNFDKSMRRTCKRDKTHSLHFPLASRGSCQWEAKAELSDLSELLWVSWAPAPCQGHSSTATFTPQPLLVQGAPTAPQGSRSTLHRRGIREYVLQSQLWEPLSWHPPIAPVLVGTENGTK